MQDRFKFRVWSKKYNKFIEDNSYPIGSDYQLIITQSGTLIKLGLGDFEDDCEDSYSWATFNDYEQDCIVMQSTGLKDKNGKLIYEGDIVKTSKGIANVEYDNTYAYFGLTNFLTVFSFDNFINEEIEVIGNRYENKELLNE